MSQTARRNRNGNQSSFGGIVQKVLRFVRMAEFEIFFVLFFFIAFLIFKNFTSRPEYNQILVKKPGGFDLWPY